MKAVLLFIYVDIVILTIIQHPDKWLAILIGSSAWLGIVWTALWCLGGLMKGVD
jgi:hypothetical protein